MAAFLSVSCVGKILNDTISDDDLPKGVLPSKEMTYGNAADEKYAAHAARFTFESSAEFPYVSMELFGDGCYLISRTFTRSDDGGIYVEGGYTVTEDNIYILENFGTLKIEENQDGYNLIFDNTAGNRISVVYAEKTPAISGDATTGFIIPNSHETAETEITVTKSWQDWSGCMVGSGDMADKSFETKLQILAAMEEAYMNFFYRIPLASSTVPFLMSYQADQYTQDYNIMYGFGGMRLMDYKLDDVAWKAWVEGELAENGELDYQ